MLGYPNRADGGTFSGGSWIASLPVSNLSSRELWKVGRSNGLTLANTKFSVDLGAAQNQRVFSLVNHNLSQTATWRVSMGTTAGATDIWQSLWKPAWTMTFQSFIEWGSSIWWSVPGGDEYLRSPYYSIILAPDTFNARYLTVEINDPTNADGYVQIGRFFSGDVIQPEYNAAMGLQDSWKDLSTAEYSESGAMWANVRRKMRAVAFSLPYVQTAEAAYFHELQRQVGITGEVLYIPYPSDLSENQRYGFLGRFTELSPFDYPFYRVRSLPVKIEELA